MLLTAYLVVAVHLIGCEGFVSNQKGHRLFPKSLTHKKITEKAIRGMAEIYMADHPEQFPRPHLTMATRDFRWAVRTFQFGSTIPDVEEELLNYPPAHFDAEKIVEANQRILEQRYQVINALSSGEMTKARELTGQLLHTMQDFYSHSNWLDIGHTDIHPALGDPEQSDNLGYVATIDEPTCTDCNTDTCRGNIRHGVISDKILTSGYVYLDTEEHSIHLSDYKPVDKGKCSHGGTDDQTRSISATGGINKDTKSELYSPHHYQHEEAAELAYEASVEFLKSIRSVRNEEEFAKYLGLVSGSSLCFIIDTTGSMSDEIAAVRDMTIAITMMAANKSHPPSDYVLVPFNDPGYGPVYITRNSEQMVRWLANLTATGGGDGPELFFHGTILALGAARPRSTCYAFTDAPAKDEHLETLAQSLADLFKIEVKMMLTGGSGYRKRRKREITSTDCYERLAMASGGRVTRTTKSDIRDAVKIIMVDLSTTQVTLVQKDKVYPGTLVNHSIYIDETLTDVVISINGAISSIDIINPDGEIEVPGSLNSSANVKVITDVRTVKIFSMPSPSFGTWTVRLSSSVEYNMAVTGSSTLSFSYQLVRDVSRGRGGYKEIVERPTTGGDQIVVLKLEGAFGDDYRPLVQITHVTLVAANGTELQRLIPKELEPFEEYEILSTLPDEGFRVAVEGTDSQGNRFRRCDPVVVLKSQVIVSVIMDSSGRFTAEPGEVLKVNISVTNKSPSTDTYSLTISDTEMFYKSIEPSVFSLEPGEIGIAVATFKSPRNASLGMVSTVSVMCRGSGYSNYAVFQLDISLAEQDTIAPVCEITTTGQTGDCSATQQETLPCDKDFWYLEFEAQDSGLGMYAIKTADSYSKANLSVEPFSPGTTDLIKGVYHSDCCKPEVTIVASDLVGNVGKCFVQHDTTPAAGVRITHRMLCLYVTLISLLYNLLG